MSGPSPRSVDWPVVAALAGACAVTIAIIVTIASLWHRIEYREWPTANSPATLSWCGREYRREPTVQPVPERIFFAFHFTPALAPDHDVYSTTPIPRRRHADEVCAMILWMRVDDGFVHYSLQGGP